MSPSGSRPGFHSFVGASLLLHLAAAGALRAGFILDAFRTDEMVIDLTASFRTRPPKSGAPTAMARVAGEGPRTVEGSPLRSEALPTPGPVPQEGGGVPNGVQDGDDPTAPLADVTALPELLDRSGLRAKLEPYYPPALKAAGVEGTVTLEVTVSSRGRIVAARALRSDPPGFEDAAVAVCRELSFRPAYRASRPVAVRIRLPLRFQIER